MATQEQEPQSREYLNIHERGGLTPVHWKEVLSRFGKLELEFKSVQKFISYGRRVISVDFPSAGFHHRDYLGLRHWAWIADIYYYPIKTMRILPPWPKRSLEIKETTKEIKIFAYSEYSNCYTLNDYIWSLGDSYTPPDPPLGNSPIILWSEEQKRWQLLRPIYRKRIIHRLMESDYIESEFEKYGFYGYPDEELILKKWLLTPEEIEHPLTTSPNSLLQFLRQLSIENPEELKNRLKAVYPSSSWYKAQSSDHFGIFEKELN